MYTVYFAIDRSKHFHTSSLSGDLLFFGYRLIRGICLRTTFIGTWFLEEIGKRIQSQLTN